MLAIGRKGPAAGLTPVSEFLQTEWSPATWHCSRWPRGGAGGRGAELGGGWGCPRKRGTGVRSGSPAGPSPHQDVQTSGAPRGPRPPGRADGAPLPHLPTAIRIPETATAWFGEGPQRGQGGSCGGSTAQGAAAPRAQPGPHVALVQARFPGSVPSGAAAPATIPAPANRQSSVAGVSETGPSNAAGNEHQEK